VLVLFSAIMPVIVSGQPGHLIKTDTLKDRASLKSGARLLLPSRI
jgi:hypothetical protein